jgi:hypothetical protein
VILLLLNAARLFGNADATRTVVHVEPRCGQMEAMWLQAQAVPTAALVPCVAPLPVGWSFRTLTVNNGRSTMSLDHDRAGAEAIVLRFAGTCDVEGATQVPADVPDASRFERRPAAGNDALLTWYEVFPGGCATIRLSSSDHSAPVVDEVTSQAGRLIDFASRAHLARVLDRRSNGRLQLDPRP